MENSSSDKMAFTITSRFWQALGCDCSPQDDRGRIRMVVDTCILHLHPTKVHRDTLKLTYTWGLGGLSALLLLILGLTGILLEAKYIPSTSLAHSEILNLRAGVWFGDLIRNLHHWSANLIVLSVVLHLLRVFLTGAYRHPRELNWLIGLTLLLLVLLANFTGYLLPWDQLGFWAITVVTSLIEYVPFLGKFVSSMLLGGSIVGMATLRNFHMIHISVIPLLMLSLASLHFWRIRKDGGLTIPKKAIGEPPKIERVTTIPHLVRREMVFALFWIAVLVLWSMLMPAPLEGIANADVSPNPAKAPWYFLGLQELLLHFHPLFGGVVIPITAFTLLAFLPFYDLSLESVGVHLRSPQGLRSSLLALILALLVTPTWVILDEYLLHWSAWLPNWPSLITEGVIPLALILSGLFCINSLLKRLFQTSMEERILFLFIFLFTSLVILTLIGIFLRGPGMHLYWPWEWQPLYL